MHLRPYVFALLLALIINTSAIAASIEVKTDLGPSEILFTGLIQTGDEIIIQQAIDEAKRRSAKYQTGWIVRFNSNGGDVHAAMAVGRVIRANGIYTTTWKCASACVLSFVGGLYRSAMTIPERQIGISIHRIYFQNISRDASREKIRATREVMLSQVYEYLKEMDIDTALLSDMESVPPEKTKLLSAEEANRYRVTGKDAAYEEHQIADDAYWYGLSSSDYRARTAEVERSCQRPAAEYNVYKTQHRRISICRIQIMLQIANNKATEKFDELIQRCVGLSSEQAGRECVRAIYLKR